MSARANAARCLSPCESLAGRKPARSVSPKRSSSSRLLASPRSSPANTNASCSFESGGGSVSGLLLQKLARRRIGYDTARWWGASPYPDDAPKGPMVCLTDEYAGSDGDVFSHSFKLLGLGKLVGKRTWGGVIGIWPRHWLVDGTVTTQPEFSFWFKDVGWGVENYGTDPDIEVDILPQDFAAGKDPQLDAAIKVALAEIVKHPPLKAPNPLTAPKRTLP